MSKFTVAPLDVPPALVVTPKKMGDHRGYFMETYHAAEFEAFGIGGRFVQDNQSMSARPGTIRGLHFQVPPRVQAKLVRVIKGRMFDVAVDLRRNSPTYGRWCAATLTADSGEQLFVPRGFAHGYCTLEADTVVAYKVDDYYAPEHESGLAWNDPALAIAWPIAPADAVLSDRDRRLPPFANFDSPFYT
jgi:dTDP-4-dehydrorhamnose 3,5-epimerase